MKPDGNWITSFEAAEMMGVTVGFIQDRCRKGYLNGSIVGKKGQGRLLVLREEIEERLTRAPRYRWQSSSASNTHYVTFETAAQILDVSWSTLRKMMKDGKVQSVTQKPVPVEERIHNHRVYFRRHEVESLAKKREPTEYPVEQIAYFAGLIDGEGSIGIGATGQRKKTASRGNISHCLHLTMGNTCFALIDWVQRTFGGKAVTQPRAKVGWSDCRYWGVQGENAERLLRLTLPYLIAKREQALVAIEFQIHVRDYRAGKQKPISREERAWREEQRRKIMALNNRYLPSE